MAKVKAEEAKVSKVTELKPVASGRISQEELLTWKLLLERQKCLQLEMQIAQSALQAHVQQVTLAHGLTAADAVDQNTGAIMRAPAPVVVSQPAQSAS